MAISRRRVFASPRQDPDNNDLIDTPEKLLQFARNRGFEAPPMPVEAIAKAFDVEVERSKMEQEELSGILCKNEKEQWVIIVNEEHHPNRQRYTIAHELGHYCLHRHLKTEFRDQIFFRAGESTKEEMQANEFASAILMPEENLRVLIRSGIKDIDQLARTFQVSTLALRIRAKNLGMTGHGL